MAQRKLKDFDPIMVAGYELRIWQHYYDHNFLRLLKELIAFLKEYFNLNTTKAICLATYSARAVVKFRRIKGKETENDYGQILYLLEKFYKAISRQILDSFDYKEVAQLELRWWKIDRYEEQYTETREEAIAAWAAELFGVQRNCCEEFARYRSEAMKLQDSYEKGDVSEVDWNQIDKLLKQSYSSLHKSVQ